MSYVHSFDLVFRYQQLQGWAKDTLSQDQQVNAGLAAWLKAGDSYKTLVSLIWASAD
jgi:hypothetical protein